MSKKILIQVIIFFIVVIIGVGGFFYFRGQNENLNNEDLNKNLKVTQNESNKNEILTRDQIEEEYKWDLSAFYKNDEEWENDFNKLENEYLLKFEKFIGQLDNPSRAIECLKLLDETSLIAEKLYYFASNTSDQDLSNNDDSERSSRAGSLYSRFGEKVAFINPEFTELPENILRGYMLDSEFSDYKHYFEILLRKKDHVLPKEEEELLAKSYDMSSSFGDIFSKLTNVDIEFPIIKDENNEDFQISEARYMTAMDSPNRDFREKAFKSLLGTYAKYENTIAEILDGKVKKDIFYARASKYDTALDSFLDNDFIDKNIYNNLVTSASENINYLHRYVNLKKKVLGIDAVHQYDMFVPLVEELDLKIPYEEGKEKALIALAPLGEKYINDLKFAFDNRWIDVYETKDKSSGAYCSSYYGLHPFILTNYTDKFNDLETLTHEMGHAINFYYSSQSQPYSNSGMSNFNAEIPSTVNELLTLKYFINNAQTDNEKLYYLNTFAESVFTSFFTQIMFSEFEVATHERLEKGEALSADYLNNLWGDIATKYFGPDYALDEETKAYWTRIRHFYAYNFYVYRYATSMAAANEFAKRILDKDDGALEKYNNFLSAGTSNYPLETLKEAGIDMTDSTLYNNLMSDFNNTLIEMEEILKKQGKI